MFFRVLFAMMVLVFFSTLAKAEVHGTTSGFVETQVQLDNEAGRQVPIMDGGVNRVWENGWGMQGFFLLTDKWAEGLIGLTYKPIDYFQIGLSVGAELGSSGNLQARYSASVWSGYKIFSFLGCVELNNAVFKGDEAGIWYDAVAKVNPISWLGVGLRIRRFIGVGPYVEGIVPIPYVPLTLWLAFAPIEQEGKDGYIHTARGLVGASINF